MIINKDTNKDFNIFGSELPLDIKVDEINGLVDIDDIARKEYFSRISTEDNDIFISSLSMEPTIVNRYLTKNKYSRPGTKRQKTTDIVFHYVGGANVPAINTRNYFENLKAGVKVNGKYVYASSQYIVGLEGEIIRCMPDDEIAYTSNAANSYSIGIECSHLNAEGKYSKKEYRSMVWLGAKLAKERNIDPRKHFKRHYDITGKLCPMWYVLHLDAWKKFKDDCYRVMCGEDLDTVLSSESSGQSNPLALVERKNYEFMTSCEVVNISKDSYVNVRDSRPVNNVLGNKIFKLYLGDIVTVSYVLDGWVYIDYKGKNGFVNTKYLSIVNTTKDTNISSKLENKKNYNFKTSCKVVDIGINSCLNVRASRPVNNTLGDKKFTMSLNDTCTVGYVLDDWAYICHNNKYGFANIKYLEIIE